MVVRYPPWYQDIIEITKHELGITAKIELLVLNKCYLFKGKKGEDSIAGMSLSSNFVKNLYPHNPKNFILINSIILKDHNAVVIDLLVHEVCHIKVVGHNLQFKQLEKKGLAIFGLKVEYANKNDPYPVKLYQDGKLIRHYEI